MNPNDRGSVAPVAADVELSEDEAGGVFYIQRDDRRIAEMTFMHDGPKRARFDHTFVTSELRGHGIARLLLDSAVEWARRTGIRIVPECSYVTAVFKRDPSIRDVLA